MVETPRERVLSRAADLVAGDRNAQYGDPNQDFARTAKMWTTYVQTNYPDVVFSSDDVAAMMILLKMSRLAWSPLKEDTWVDIAGYAACGWDCVCGE